MGRNGAGTVYLLHFNEPYHHSQHYVGWVRENPDDRLQTHLDGRGSPLVYAASRAGIDVRVVRTWPGDRNLERQLKNQKNARKLCPECNEEYMRRKREAARERRRRKRRQITVGSQQGE